MSTSTDRVPALDLNSGGSIPQYGFGMWQVPQDVAFQCVAQALEVGYRHIDTAAAYGNEAQVGQAVRASGLDRADVFITTKLFNDDHGHEQAKHAFKASLDRLELEYIDLYLIHWPVPAHDKYVETWQALVELQQEGFVRAIGTSNFQAEHLRRIIDATGVTPAVNQIELHPYLTQHGLRREHADRGILTEAWSPLAKGAPFAEPVVTAAAERTGKTPAQVLLRWQLQLGNIVFPKSVTPERIAENFDVFDFHLTDDEVAAIEGLDRGERTGPDPDTFVRP